MGREENIETAIEDQLNRSDNSAVANAADISPGHDGIADGEAQSPEGRRPVKQTSGWGMAAAAFIAVGATVTFAQGITALMLGTSQYYDWRMSSGGLLAVGVAIYVGVKCRSWWEWRKHIWPWLVVAGAIAAVMTVIQASQVDGETEDLPRRPTSALISNWEKVDTPAKREVVPQETGSVLVDFTEIKICHVGQLWSDCIDRAVADYEGACQRQNISEATPEYRFETDDGPILTACEIQLRYIKDMQNEGGADYTVETSGMTKLVVTPEVRSVSVISEPETSHLATCILGFIGECD